MRTLLVMIALLSLATCALGQTPPPAGNESVKVDNSKISLSLSSVSLEDALAQIFSAIGAKYIISPAAKQHMVRYSYPRTLNKNNYTIDSALKAVFEGAYDYVQDDGVYVILQTGDDLGLYRSSDGYRYVMKEWAKDPKKYGAAPTPMDRYAYGPLPLIDLDIPEMSVEEAYKAVVEAMYPQGTDHPLWRFENGLGKTVMRGVKFNDFPPEEAMRVVVYAAGLTPPERGWGKTVKARRNAASSFSTNSSLSAAMYSASIAAYKTASGQWNYIIASSEGAPRDIFSNLFRLSGKSYSIAQDENETKRQTVATQLIDVTFDEALKAIARALGMTYRVDGNIYTLYTSRDERSGSGPIPAPDK